ncbi:hypothetical protein [Halosimplex pelagicum]|uniref:RelE toxin-related domain-containing protein n=1 Tax=Halosimplex pelagicum TaxID=869886 RepID=A0A7D5TB60_9EURY|nr:hypothetical protein [Halosimplex pelagicum]QLH81015.1 hypothetical protein HZS54_04905 [Halosimplex pelagicum]
MSRATAADTGTPPVTEHAADRWDARTDPASVAPETAWRHAQRVRAAERPTGTDEVRFHAPSGALLLRCGTSIVTVLDATDDDPRRDVQQAVAPLLERDRA